MTLIAAEMSSWIYGVLRWALSCPRVTARGPCLGNGAQGPHVQLCRLHHAQGSPPKGRGLSLLAMHPDGDWLC